MMRIGLDVSVTRIDKAGSGVYTLSLLDALQTYHPEHAYRTFAFGGELDVGRARPLSQRFENIVRDTAWSLLLLPLAAQRAGLDVLHLPTHRGPLWCPTPTVMTFLDLTNLRYPEAFNTWSTLYSRVLYKPLARQARRLIAISEHTRRDVVQFLGVPADKIDVVYPGLQAGYTPVTDRPQLEQTLARYGLPDRFILTVSTLEPRKNIPRLLRAYQRLRAAGQREPLVLVGRPGWRYSEIHATWASLGLGDAVRFLGYVPKADMPSLYSAATLMVYPSLYEGFGLPPLEAMACGCPVVASNTSSLPEVVGNAGLLVDPLDEAALAEAMRAVLTDPAAGEAMRARGLARVGRFTWQAAADATIRTYQRAAGSSQ